MLLKGTQGIIFGVSSQRSIAHAVAEAWKKNGCERIALVCKDEGILARLKKQEGFEYHVCNVDNDLEIKACFEKIYQNNNRPTLLLHSIAFGGGEH